jgi:hypothetical protein
MTYKTHEERRAYYYRNRERILRVQREWYQRTKPARNAYQRRHRRANLPMYAARRRRYYQRYLKSWRREIYEKRRMEIFDKQRKDPSNP